MGLLASSGNLFSKLITCWGVRWIYESSCLPDAHRRFEEGSWFCHWRTQAVKVSRFIKVERESSQPCQLVPCLGEFLSISCKIRVFLVQSRLLTKCSGHIPNQLVLFCQNKLLLQFQILMLFFNILYETALQFLCNVKVTIALCFMRWLMHNDDEYIFYPALSHLLRWFWELVNVYKVSLCLWTKQSKIKNNWPWLFYLNSIAFT